VPCPPGVACTSDGLGAPDGVCAAGYYCSTTATSISPPADEDPEKYGQCPPGFFCDEGSGWPTPCPPGTYNDGALGTSSASCRDCTPGSFCASSGLSAPTDLCAAGYYCEAASTSARPAAGLCPAGSACPAGSPEHVVCDSGSYQPRKGRPTCDSCPAGYQCTTSVKSECGADHYCEDGTSTAQLCPTGTYTRRRNARGAAECAPCPPGFYCV